jgi:hypothetical protein
VRSEKQKRKWQNATEQPQQRASCSFSHALPVPPNRYSDSVGIDSETIVNLVIEIVKKGKKDKGY